MAYTDAFNYPDGPIPLPWVVAQGNCNISGGDTQETNFLIVNSLINLPGDADLTASVNNYGSWDMFRTMELYIKCDATASQAYIFYVISWYDYSVAFIQKNDNGTMTTLAQTNIAIVHSGELTLGFTYSAGTLNGYVNNTLVATATDNAFDGHPRIGLQNQQGRGFIHSITVSNFSLASMVVTPNPLWLGAGRTLMMAEGSGVTWTPGVPGSSTITVDHGTIDTQFTQDATHIQFWYTPAEYLGPITFSESQYSLQAVINGTILQQPGEPGIGTGLSDKALAYLEYRANQGGWGIQNTAANIGTVPIDVPYIEAIKHIYQFVDFYYPQGSPGAGPIDQITKIWGVLNGNLEPPPTPSLQYDGTTVQGNLRTVLDNIIAMRGPNGLLGLQDILNQMTTGSTDLTPVLNKIGEWQGHPLWSVFDLLLFLSNNAAWTATDERSRWDSLIGEPWWGIGDVIGLSGRPLPGEAPSLHNISEWLKGVRGDTNTTLSDTHAQAFLSASTATNIMTSLNSLRTSHGYTIQSIIDAMPNGGSVDLSSVLTAISSLRGDSVSTVKQLKDAANALSYNGTIDLQDVINAIGHPSGESTWTTFGLLALLLLVLLGLPEEAAVVAGAGGALSAGALLAILGGVADVASILSNVYNWLHSQKLWTLQPAVPNYPGSNLVDWQEPVAFDTDGVIERHMDGARIVVDTPGKAPWAYATGKVTRYGRLGVFAFQSDLGARETIQPVTFLDQIATPKAIVSPWAMVIQCKPGTLGTVTPYTLKRA